MHRTVAAVDHISVNGVQQQMPAYATRDETARVTSKQPRLLPLNVNSTPQHVNHLARLPLEMLYEVLSNTSSPDILALSRTSRYFCMTLISDTKIWRDARKRFLPKAIPDPTPNWTESAYIAFLFDGKPCEVCAEISYRTPISFALRAHVCYNVYSCEATWRASLKSILPSQFDNVDLPHIAAVQSWLPYHEAPSDFQPAPKAYRLLEWEAAVNQHKTSMQNPVEYAIVQQEFARKATRLSQIMNHAKALAEWAESLEELRKVIKNHCIKFLGDKAMQEKWIIQDLVNAPLYEILRLYHIKVLEKIDDKVFEAVKDQLRQEVEKCGEDRIRSIIDNTTRANRKDLHTYWNKLCSMETTKKAPLPPYSEFRQLNIVKTLEAKNTTEAAALKESVVQTVNSELKFNGETRTHIYQEASNWLRLTRKRLAIKLGDSYSPLTITGSMHTVDRTTAWFRCKRCKKVGRKASENQALTFANVCTHRCLGVAENTQWDVNFFEPDTKAIAAANELLRVCGLDERTATRADLGEFGCRFLCKNCTETIVMDASAVVGHSKRHDTMVLELLTHNQAKAVMAAPLERGLVSKLTGKSRGGERMRQKKVYVCRHCNNKPLTFDGLRSHMKSKHHYTQLRDEDFYELKKAAAV